MPELKSMQDEADMKVILHMPVHFKIIQIQALLFDRHNEDTDTEVNCERPKILQVK